MPTLLCSGWHLCELVRDSASLHSQDSCAMQCNERHNTPRVVYVVILYAAVGVHTPLCRDVDSRFATLRALLVVIV